MGELTAKEVGEELNLTHLQVIRYIRRGQIKAKKWGWLWAIEQKEVARVKSQDWYRRLMKKREQRAANN